MLGACCTIFSVPLIIAQWWNYTLTLVRLTLFSLLYLSVFRSRIGLFAFLLYFDQRHWPEKCQFTVVLFPVVAVILEVSCLKAFEIT